MRRIDWVMVLLLAFGALAGPLLRGPTPLPENANPRRPAPHLFEDTDKDKPWAAQTAGWLREGPAAKRNDVGDGARIARESLVDIPFKRSSGTGTAFAVAKDGVWLTARHVVDGCDEVGILTGPRKGIRVQRRFVHPRADVAVLMTANAPTPLPLAASARSTRDGFHVGFPKGSPGALFGRRLGETRLRSKGRYSTSERAAVWSERSRIPARFDSLGGMSGGPVFAGDGRVIGVVLAESPRRGRTFSALPDTIAEALSVAGRDFPPATDGDTRAAADLSAGDYPLGARRLITDLRVAKVVCRAK